MLPLIGRAMILPVMLMRVGRSSRASQLLALGAALLLSAACATARSDAHPVPTRDPSALTLRDVYARMLGAISRPGEFYHPTIESAALQGAFTLAKKQEGWIDPAGGRARIDVTSSFGDAGTNVHASTWIIDGRRWYQTLEDTQPRKRQALTCHESDDPLLSLVLGCHGSTEVSTTVVAGDIRYHDHAAIAIISDGIAPGADVRQSFHDILYVDATTYLPIAIESDGRLADASAPGSPTQTTGELIRFTNNFVPVETMPQDFFSPSAIGYSEPDPVAALGKSSPDFTYVWLGASVPPADGLPGLALDAAFVADGEARPLLRYRAVLRYRVAGDDFGGAAAILTEWRLDEWQAASAGRNWWDTTCAHGEPVDLAGARSVIYSTDGVPERDGCIASGKPLLAAEIDLGATVVIATSPDGSPYASVDGMRRIVASISAR